jgi:oligosaccharide repeat unit polymerase
MVALPLTMYVVSKLVGFRAKEEFHSYWNAPITEVFTTKKSKQEFYWLFCILSVVSLGSVIYTAWKTPSIPIFSLLHHTDTSAATLRIEAKESFAGSVYIKNIFAIGLTPILSLIAYVYALKTKELRWRVLFALLFVAAVFIQVYDMQKAPLLFYLLMVLLVRMYVGKTKLDMKKLVILLSIAALYLVMMYVALGVTDSSAFLSYSSGPIGRTILTQIAPMYLYIDRYDAVYPYLEEKGLPSAILQLYGIDQTRSSRVLMEEIFPERVKEGTAGVMNTLYVGEAYATFGWAGVVVGTIVLGVFIQFLYILFMRLPKHPIFLSLYVYFSINIPRAMVGGFFDLLVNPVWMTIVLLVVLPYLIVAYRSYQRSKLSPKLE